MFGVTGLEREWFELYLTGRSQCMCVLMANFLMSLSEFCKDPFWAPFFYPVCKWHTQCVKTLRDNDTALSHALKSTTDLERNSNEDIVYLKEYFVINKLSFNIQKCEFLTVGTWQCLTMFKDVDIIYM